MAKKTSVYFGEPLMELTNGCDATSGPNSVSGRINRTAERYLAILQRHGLDLTEQERDVLKSCLSGSWVEPLLIRHLADEVEDSERFEEQDPAALTLVDKLRGASFADLVATVEKLGF